MHSHVPAGIVPYEELVYTSENFSFEVNILTGSKHQFSLQLLDMVENYLVSKGYVYCRLDGSTKIEERARLVRSFNTDPTQFVFLISKKWASSTGELTSQCDRWWILSVWREGSPVAIIHSWWRWSQHLNFSKPGLCYCHQLQDNGLRSCPRNHWWFALLSADVEAWGWT